MHAKLCDSENSWGVRRRLTNHTAWDDSTKLLQLDSAAAALRKALEEVYKFYNTLSYRRHESENSSDMWVHIVEKKLNNGYKSPQCCFVCVALALIVTKRSQLTWLWIAQRTNYGYHCCHRQTDWWCWCVKGWEWAGAAYTTAWNKPSTSKLTLR